MMDYYYYQMPRLSREWLNEKIQEFLKDGGQIIKCDRTKFQNLMDRHLQTYGPGANPLYKKTKVRHG